MKVNKHRIRSVYSYITGIFQEIELATIEWPYAFM